MNDSFLLLKSAETPEINSREILHAHAAVALMRAKNALQLSHHGSVVRMTFCRSERAAAQAPAKSLPIQNLIIRQVARYKIIRFEEVTNVLDLRIRILHGFVVNAEALQQTLVITCELRFFHTAVVPKDHEPSTRLQYANEFAARRAGLKPMERLSGGHELHAGVGERGGLRGTVHAGEVRVRAQILLAGLAHLLIGLDAENVVAIFEEKLAEEAGAGTDVRDDLAGEQAAFRAQKIEHRRRIAWAIANIVRSAIGEALFGVGKNHLHGHKGCRKVSDMEERFLTPLRSVRNDGPR